MHGAHRRHVLVGVHHVVEPLHEATHSGRTAEAQVAVAELLSINPAFTLGGYEAETRFSAPDDRMILFDGLRRAGLT